ncbi:MAG: MCE family protein, partial [Laribacter sp.]|nr:MCE family protein [Laribacter sp.]
MDDTRPLFRVGLLVLLGIGLLVVLTFLLGARRWFQPSVEVETYFNESVNGLEVGSPVKFRGVQIGEVSEVTVSTWVYQLSTPLEERHNYIIVRSVLRGRDMGISQATLREYLDRGLRFQTQLAGITGQL